MGVARIILSRELSLDEIEKIRQECPDMELEVFVHGALCIAYSGRCLLSGYFNRRDPNQGTCTNACRWNYATHDADSDPTTRRSHAVKLEGDFNFEAAQQEGRAIVFRLRRRPAPPARPTRSTCSKRSRRPGQLMPIMEDEHGTYIMNSKDLRAVEHVERLVQIGVDSLKIEGRTKSQYYVARTAQVYRRAIDDAVAGRPFNPELLPSSKACPTAATPRLAGAPPQPTTTRTTKPATPRPSAASSWARSRPCADGWAEVETKNRFAVGDTLEIIHPSGNRTRSCWSR
jgi:putative protease